MSAQLSQHETTRLLIAEKSENSAYALESKLRDAGSLGGIRLAGSEDPGMRKVYIVQLATPSAADFHAKMRPITYTAGATRTRFDKSAPAIQE